MKLFFVFIILFSSLTLAAQEKPVALKYAQQLLHTAQAAEPDAEMQTALAGYDAAALQKELNTDELRKAFWINIYNAAVIIGQLNNPQWFKDSSLFFKKKLVTIAGTTLSALQIQNGILRFAAPGNKKHGKFEKKFGIQKFDNRIHFALNNGTANAPAIQVYDDADIDAALNEATTNYIKAAVKMNEGGYEVNVPEWMRTFLPDFGETDGLITLFRKKEVVFMNLMPRIVWKPQTWQPITTAAKNTP